MRLKEPCAHGSGASLPAPHAVSQLLNAGPVDFEEGNEKIILAVTWALIQFYELSEKSGDSVDSEANENAGGVKGLLEWATAEAEKEGVSIGSGSSAWTSSFKDGKAFAAIINAVRPGIIDFESTKSMVGSPPPLSPG